MWDRILAHKEIVCEPRTGGREGEQYGPSVGPERVPCARLKVEFLAASKIS